LIDRTDDVNICINDLPPSTFYNRNIPEKEHVLAIVE